MTSAAGAPATVVYRPSTEARVPEFDGLRCLAVLMVVVSHALPDSPWNAQLGADGVRLFFVLSGFLITGILLRQRGTFGALGRFYARRALRIFPAYYALLAAAVLANVPSARADWPWHAGYASNWLIALYGGQWHGVRYYMSHLWSLAVEEQFYLVWPLLVLTLPRSWMDRAFVGVATVAVVFRGAASLAINDQGRVLVPTFSSLDALALGALLAWRWSEGAKPVSRWVLGVGMLLVVHGSWLAAAERGFLLLMTTRPLGMSLVAMYAIDRAPHWRVLRWRPAVSLGRISYGVYLWHVPVLWALSGWRKPGIGLFLADLAITICCAALSWQLIEQPCNRLKQRFPMAPSFTPAG